MVVAGAPDLCLPPRLSQDPQWLSFNEETGLLAGTEQHASIVGLTLHVDTACCCASEMVSSRHNVTQLVCADLLHQALSQQGPR